MSIEQDRHVLYVDGKKHIEAARGAMDIFGADNVEVQIDYDRRKLWVNVNGWCALRVHNIRVYAPFPLAPYDPRSPLPICALGLSA